MAEANPLRLIAEHVVDLINSIPDERISIPKTEWTAERSYVAYFKGERINDLKIVVYPDGLGGDGPDDRECELMEGSVSVAVIKNVARDIADTDLLFDLVGQIQDWVSLEDNRIFDNSTEDGNPDEVLIAELVLPFEIDPVIDQKALHERGEFVSRTFFNYNFTVSRRA